MPERQPPLELPTNAELLSAILEIPGALGETYNRFHNYSARNIGFLALQGCAPCRSPPTGAGRRSASTSKGREGLLDPATDYGPRPLP